MRRSLTLLGVVALAVLLASSASATNRGVTFTGIGQHPDSSGPFAASQAISINPQGTIVMASPSYFGIYCIQWTQDGGWGTEVGEAGSACRMSSEGTIMASGGDFDLGAYRAGTWAGEADVWNFLPEQDGFEPCGSSYMSFYDMGGDGDYATGLTWEGCTGAQAFRWDKATNTTVGLGSPNGDSSRGNAISPDGDTVVGWGTMLFGNRRAASWNDGDWSWVDGQGNIEPMACVGSGKSCTYNGDDPVYGCPDEYVDDSLCELATCSANVCIGGPNAGSTCAYDYECAGYCKGGPNDGDTCTGDYYCPDTEACAANPDWSNDAYKGEARDISASGHVVGRNYGGDYPAWNSAWRANPDGSFTEIPTAPSYPDTWEPNRISEDGKTVVGNIGNPFFGAIPAFWNEGTGTQDLQLFLVQQGLDELFFWYLTGANDVSADGTKIVGAGISPDGLLEGFVVDIAKVWICHAPAGNPDNARTLGISLGSVGDHVAHGDFLGTCEFLNSGGLSRAADLREQLNQRAESELAGKNPFLRDGGSPDRPIQTNGAVPSLSENPQRPISTRTGARSSERSRR